MQVCSAGRSGQYPSQVLSQIPPTAPRVVSRGTQAPFRPCAFLRQDLLRRGWLRPPGTAAENYFAPGSGAARGFVLPGGKVPSSHFFNPICVDSDVRLGFIQTANGRVARRGKAWFVPGALRIPLELLSRQRLRCIQVSCGHSRPVRAVRCSLCAACGWALACCPPSSNCSTIPGAREHGGLFQ